MTFESEGLLIVAIYIWLPPASYVVFLTTLVTFIIMKLHMQTTHESRMCPIDFEVKRSKVKVTMHKLLKNCPRGGY